MTSFDERFTARPKRTIAGVVGWAVFGIVVLGGIGTGLALLAQPGRILTKTFDADNVLYNYEWFRQQYQDIGAINGKIATMQAGADTAIGDEKVRLNSIVLGLTTKRAQMVADYNARGSMANRSIFIAGLPQQIQ